MTGLVLVDVVVAGEVLVQLGVVRGRSAHKLHQAGDVLHDGPGVDPGVALGPAVFRVGPRAVGVGGPA